MTKKIVTALACTAMLFTALAQAETLSSSLSLDFSDGGSKFTPKSRVTCTVEDEVQLITAANNAGNGYALAYYDFSDISKGADRVEVEFDSQIESGSRYWVSLYDAANRGTEAAGSSKSTYNTDYLIYSAGTGDGTYYYANGTSVSNAFGNMVHTSVTVDFNTDKVSYTVTSSAGTKLLEKSEQDFYNLEKKAEECTGIEFYTWQNNAVAKIDNLSVKAYVNGSNVDNTVDLSKFDAQGSYNAETGTETLSLGAKKWSKLDLTSYTSSDDYIKNITVSYKETISGTGRTAVGFYDNDKAVWATNAYQDTAGGALVYGITGSNYSRRISV